MGEDGAKQIAIICAAIETYRKKVKYSARWLPFIKSINLCIYFCIAIHTGGAEILIDIHSKE